MDGSYGIKMNYVADLRIYKQDQINWDDIIQGNLSLDDVDSEQTEKTTKSDDEGNYEIYVIPGKYDFYAERQGFLVVFFLLFFHMVFLYVFCMFFVFLAFLLLL